MPFLNCRFRLIADWIEWLLRSVSGLRSIVRGLGFARGEFLFSCLFRRTWDRIHGQADFASQLRVTDCSIHVSLGFGITMILQLTVGFCRSLANGLFVFRLNLLYSFTIPLVSSRGRHSNLTCWNLLPHGCLSLSVELSVLVSTMAVGKWSESELGYSAALYLISTDRCGVERWGIRSLEDEMAFKITIF